MRGHVLILGANGRFGRAACDAFASAGWAVTAQMRRAPRTGVVARSDIRSDMPSDIAGHSGPIVPLVCELSDADRLATGAQGAQVVVNALNPPYTLWEQEALPMAQIAIAVARALGATLMLPGNVYNYGADMPSLLGASTPFAPTTSKGRIRVAIEHAMRAAADDGVRSVVVRAGDFFGGDGPGTWLDIAIARNLARSVVTYPGPLDRVHAWAYLPDLAHAFVQLARVRTQLEAFESIHFGGHPVTGADWVAALERIAGRPLRVRDLPWWAMRALSPFVPTWRAVLEMRYLWQVPHALDDTRLHRLVPDLHATPFDAAVRKALCLAVPAALPLESARADTA